MARVKPSVAEIRKYLVTTVAQAKVITTDWLMEIELCQVIDLGLTEVDDRYHIWRVPLLNGDTKVKIGEVVIDAYTTNSLAGKDDESRNARGTIAQEGRGARDEASSACARLPNLGPQKHDWPRR